MIFPRPEKGAYQRNTPVSDSKITATPTRSAAADRRQRRSPHYAQRKTRRRPASVPGRARRWPVEERRAPVVKRSISKPTLDCRFVRAA